MAVATFVISEGTLKVYGRIIRDVGRSSRGHDRACQGFCVTRVSRVEVGGPVPGEFPCAIKELLAKSCGACFVAGSGGQARGAVDPHLYKAAHVLGRSRIPLFSGICVSRRQADAAIRIQAPVSGLSGFGQGHRASLQAYARMRAVQHKVDSIRRAARLLVTSGRAMLARA